MKASTQTSYRKMAFTVFILGAIGIYVPNYNKLENVPRTVFITLPPNQTEPEVSIDISTNASGKLTLEIKAKHFEFTEFCKTKSKKYVIGHAHIIVNDETIGTAYNPLFEIHHLEPGLHEIKVTLQGQDHRTLVGKDGIIGASTLIRIPIQEDA